MSLSARLGLDVRIRTVLALDPQAPAVESDGRWSSWGDLAAVAEGVESVLTGAGVAEGTPVGIVLRNEPALIGAILGVLLARCCVVTINSAHGDAGLSADVEAVRAPVLIGTRRDWDRPGVAAAASESMQIVVTEAPGGVSLVAGCERPGAGPFRPVIPGTAVEMLTSGTTGPPKRIPLGYQAFERTIGAAGAHYGSDGGDLPRLRSGVAIISSPLVHMSGLFRTLLNVCQGRRIALMQRFGVEEFAALVSRHRPRAVSLVPAALSMVLDADVDPDVFACVDVVTSGTAHLPVALQENFEQRYGVAVLPSYGATEFAGGVAGWNLQLHQEWASSKRGSVGRPQGGREIRIVAVQSDAEMPCNEPGVVEVRTGGEEWVRTTDLGRVDADGFVFIDGRTDDVIVRGGFKITPADVVAALREHPDVRDAGVVGLPDERLGAVPVAAVEPVVGTAPSEAELLAHLRQRLSRYQVPARLIVVDDLPRTPSLKVSQPGIRTLFEKETEKDMQ